MLPETPPLLEMHYENKGNAAGKALCLTAQAAELAGYLQLSPQTGTLIGL